MLNKEQAYAVESSANKILVLAGAGTGKALKNGTGVLTPSGYVPIESLKVGDLVYASNGNAYPVTGVYPQGKIPVWEMSLNHRVSILCSSSHLWLYQTASQRCRDQQKFKIATTIELASIPPRKKKGKYNSNNIYLPMCQPIQFQNNAELPVHPYLLGFILANGSTTNRCISICTPCADVIEKIDTILKDYNCTVKHCLYGKHVYDYRIVSNVRENAVTRAIRTLGLMGHTAYDKYIPTQYLYASVSDRMQLLQGLFDGDGCNRNNINEYATASEQLSNDIIFLCESLGMTVTHTLKTTTFAGTDGNKKAGADTHRLLIKTPKQLTNIYTSERHTSRKQNQQCYARRYVRAIKSLGYEAEMTCISVASPDESFITEHCVVTHNTHTMISRIVRLVESGVKPEGILALTFTNAAAFEMRNRYSKLLADCKSPAFKTFHSFCYSVMSKPEIYRKHGYTTIPKIISEIELYEIKNSCKLMCGTKLSDKKICGNGQLSRSEQFQLEILNKSFTQELRKRNEITFDILCSKICSMFESKDPDIAQYFDDVTHIFVDEFQDTDPMQWRFVQSFKNSNLFIVGDAKQSIYGFRGADSSIIKAVSANPDWETIRLSSCYRSTIQICEYANDIHKDWENQSYDLKLHSDRIGAKVVDVRHSSFDWDAFTDAIRKQKSDGCSIAILSRTNAEADKIASELKRRGVSTTRKLDSAYKVEILKSAVDSEFKVQWLSSLMSADAYANFIRISNINPNARNVDTILMLYHSLYSICENIEDVKNMLASDRSFSDKVHVISNMLSINLGMFPYRMGSYSSQDVIDCIIDNMESDTGNDAYVGTIHSAKGLEWDSVHVIGAGGKHFQINSEESKNLFYVACTRAKILLSLWCDCSLYYGE